MWRHVIVQATLQLTLLAIATSAKGADWLSGAPTGTSAFVHAWGSSSSGIGGSGSSGGSGRLQGGDVCSPDVHRNTLTFAVFVACQVGPNNISLHFRIFVVVEAAGLFIFFFKRNSI